MSKNARYDLAVANLRVAPVSSTGGNLCFADPHSDPESLLTAAGASMLHHSTAQSSGGPPLQHGPGPSCVRGYLELGYLESARGSWRRPARPGHRPGRTTSNDPARQLENGSQARSGREAAVVVSSLAVPFRLRYHAERLKSDLPTTYSSLPCAISK